MPKASLGVLIAFITPVVHAWANTLDGYFSNTVFKSITAIIFLSAVMNLAFLPIAVLIDPPKWLMPGEMGLMLLIILIEVAYQYPYYWSLRNADTSVVAALFSVGQLFVPLQAILILGEHLGGMQYVGFFLIVSSSVLLTVDIRNMRINQAFWAMIIVTALLSLQSVLLKYLFDQGMGWGTAIVWIGVGAALASSAAMICSGTMRPFVAVSQPRRAALSVFIMQTLTWVGDAASTYAIFLVPVSIAKGIGSTQPAFVLLYAVLLAKAAPSLFREHIETGALRRKAVLFVLMGIGVTVLLRA